MVFNRNGIVSYSNQRKKSILYTVCIIFYFFLLLANTNFSKTHINLSVIGYSIVFINLFYFFLYLIYYYY